MAESETSQEKEQVKYCPLKGNWWICGPACAWWIKDRDNDTGACVLVALGHELHWIRRMLPMAGKGY